MPRTPVPSELLDHSNKVCKDAGALIRQALSLSWEEFQKTGEMQYAIARIAAWMYTASKLNHEGDFQAASSAVRAIFETSVDMTLLCEGDEDESKLEAHEESMKLGAANKIVEVYGRNPDEAPTLVRGAIRFLVENENRIKKRRRQYWPKLDGRHPSRWTGRTLAEDAKLADNLMPGEKFDRWYRWKYSWRCIAVHGSGSGGLRDEIPQAAELLTAQALIELAHFALVASEQILGAIGKSATRENLTEFRKNNVGELGHLLDESPEGIDEQIAEVRDSLGL